MDDFLSSLVSKSLSVAPIIQPRPVSLFEPWQPGTPELTLPIDLSPTDQTPSMESKFNDRAHSDPRPPREHYDRFAEETHAYTAPAAERLRQSPPVTLQAVLAPMPGSAQPLHRAVSHEMAASPPISQRPPASIDLPRSVPPVPSILERVIIDRGETGHDHSTANQLMHHHDTQPALTESVHPNDVSPAPSSVNPVIERFERVILEHTQANLEQIDPGQTAQDYAPPLVSVPPAVQRVTVEPERSESALPKAPQTTGDMSAPGLPAPPRLTPSIERVRESVEPRQADRANMAQPQQPTIHVTIGRIEVRATSSTAPVKRVSPPATTMTLEEYLRSRAGDKR
jgi:hypothetical protein